MPANKQTAKAEKRPRVRQTAKHRSFRLTKQKYKQNQLLSLKQLISSTLSLVWGSKGLFLAIAIVYSLLSLLFSQGLGTSFELAEIKKGFEEAFGEESSQLLTSLALFGYVLGSSGNAATEAASAYQALLLLITALAVIWGVRQIQAGEHPKMRDCFYKGMYPLIPFILVITVITLQLIPLLLGNIIYSTVLQNSLAVTAIEQVLWLLLFILLALLSGYMLTSSLFALFIVTLPDMTPIRALRSARELVLHRRLAVGWRLLILPVLMMLLIAIIIFPLLIFAVSAAQIVFTLISSIVMIISITYIYNLYRALL